MSTSLRAQHFRKIIISACASFVAISLIDIQAAAAAAISVVLNFDSGGANAFLNQINAAAVTAGLGANYFPAADANAIKTAIQNEMTTVYNGFNINFTTTATAGARSFTFGDNSTSTSFGLAPFNYRNAFLANTTGPANDAAIVGQIFPKNFNDSLSAAATVPQNEARLAIAIGDTASHELGHTFGLDHQDDYGDPRITPANYANTNGIQNTHIMATGITGLSNDRSTPRRFGQLELAKLAQSVNLVNGFNPNLIADAGDNHTALSTAGANAAQPITFVTAPLANIPVVTITGGTIGTAGIHDVYSFQATAGTPLTADIISASASVDDLNAGNGYFKTPTVTVLRLYRLNGGSPVQLQLSPDKEYSGNNFLSGNIVDLDPMILNFPLPANDTYFLDVQGNTTGNYEMFVSVPEPLSLAFLLTGSFTLLLRRRAPNSVVTAQSPSAPSHC
jgi:hypothetical protein